MKSPFIVCWLENVLLPVEIGIRWQSSLAGSEWVYITAMQTYFRESSENVQASFQIAIIILVIQKSCLQTALKGCDGNQWPKQND